MEKSDVDVIDRGQAALAKGLLAVSSG